MHTAWAASPNSDDAKPDQIETLKFGMSTALSGPAAELGINMRHGILVAFDEADKKNKLPNKRLELVSLDDGYEPARTAPNMHRLMAQHRVLSVIGNVGTPTAITAIPIARKANTPFFGAFTGANILRSRDSSDIVINYRASYAEETAAMVDALVAKGIRPEEIGFFTQNDSYGDDGFFGGLAAIRRHKAVKVSDVPHGRYRRNTSQIEDGLADLLMQQPLPKAVIMVGTYEPCSKLVRLARMNDFNPQFLAVSFVGTDALQRSLGEIANGIVATQVVPHFDSDLPLVLEYREAMRAYDPEVPQSFVSLEGYIVGRILIKAVASIRGEVSRTAIAKSLEQLGQFDIGLDSPLTLGPDDHQASSRVWPVLIETDGTRSLSWEDLLSE
ncbi:ABC transporter substrate-binding protein [Rhodopirellula bahusiensis]|uniref:ABC transporter substrate-binding protein n=1 Tax=Rhodopirellula bahusiensis TaxID=2014065 RepID=UPI003266838D